MIHQCKKVQARKTKEKLCKCVGGKMVDCKILYDLHQTCIRGWTLKQVSKSKNGCRQTPPDTLFSLVMTVTCSFITRFRMRLKKCHRACEPSAANSWTRYQESSRVTHCCGVSGMTVLSILNNRSTVLGTVSQFYVALCTTFIRHLWTWQSQGSCTKCFTVLHISHA